MNDMNEIDTSEIDEIRARINIVLRQVKDQVAVARCEIIRHQNVLSMVGSEESEAMLQRAADKCDTWSKDECQGYVKRVTDIEHLANCWLGPEPNTDIDGLIKQIAESHRKMEDSVDKLDELMKGLDE